MVFRCLIIIENGWLYILVIFVGIEGGNCYDDE